MAAENIVIINKDNWQSEVMDKSKEVPVLVDFWAEWCGPCKAIAPVLDQLAGELDGKLQITKVNVDEAPDLAGQFGIRSIPTLLIFKDGVVAEQMVGAMNKAALQSKIDEHISE